MSKSDIIQELAKFIGLSAAHNLLKRYTNKPESREKLQKEEEFYRELSTESIEGNWNENDLLEITERAITRCKKKLNEYLDIQRIEDIEIRLLVEQILSDINQHP